MLLTVTGTFGGMLFAAWAGVDRLVVGALGVRPRPVPALARPEP
jgi:hypothetical protein